jgi:methionyl-tRNA synthetase
MEELLHALGCTFELQGDKITQLKNQSWNKVFTVQKNDPLFQKPEPTKEVAIEAAIILEPQPTSADVTIDDVMKVELRAGTISACVRVSGSEKLLRLEVDFGDAGRRTIFSGIQKHYSPEQLIGKQAIFVFNLKPRKMMGEASCGMLLTAEDQEGRLAFITPERPVPNGRVLK